jgi:hypothetical protein
MAKRKETRGDTKGNRRGVLTVGEFGSGWHWMARSSNGKLVASSVPYRMRAAAMKAAATYGPPGFRVVLST